LRREPFGKPRQKGEKRGEEKSYTYLQEGRKAPRTLRPALRKKGRRICAPSSSTRRKRRGIGRGLAGRDIVALNRRLGKEDLLLAGVDGKEKKGKGGKDERNHLERGGEIRWPFDYFSDIGRAESREGGKKARGLSHSPYPEKKRRKRRGKTRLSTEGERKQIRNIVISPTTKKKGREPSRLSSAIKKTKKSSEGGENGIVYSINFGKKGRGKRTT